MKALNILYTLLYFLCSSGDLIGSALQGTDQLLSLPSGCGEQNMAKFALNIYVKDYLESTNQMTEDIKKLADDYMKHGE